MLRWYTHFQSQKSINKSVEKTYVPLVCSLLITEKRFNAGISVVITENSVDAMEKSGFMTEHRLYFSISQDLEITNV